MKIISNTGPIIGLAKIDLLFLLNQIAQEVLIPPMVHRELMGKAGPETAQIDKALGHFLKVADLKPLNPAVEKTISALDEGEREVIGLASKTSGHVLTLMDDRAGREAAARLNIPVSGLVGILLLAKEKGIVKKIGPLLLELRDKGYWLSDEVIQAAQEVMKQRYIPLLYRVINGILFVVPDPLKGTGRQLLGRPCEKIPFSFGF